MKGHAFVDPLNFRQNMLVVEDFENDIDSTKHAITATDSGTGAVAGGFCGVLPLVASDGTVADNDECYFETVNEYVSFVANQPWHLCGRIQFNEANIDDANVFFGVATAPGANTLQDNGAGMDPTLTSLAAIYKVDGSNKWKVTAGGSAAEGVANVKTSQRNASPGVAGVSGPWQWLEIIHTPVTTTQGKVTFRVNGEDLRDPSVLGSPLIELPVTYSGSTTMAICAGVKNGGANLETLNIDGYIFQARRSGPC